MLNDLPYSFIILTRFVVFQFCSRALNFQFLNFSAHLQERPAAFVFFKTRYDALVVSEILQTPNPMLWVADLAPEPHDVYWKNLKVPYRQLWMRKIATLVGTIAFMFVFLLPVTAIQGLTQLPKLSKNLPFLSDLLKK